MEIEKIRRYDLPDTVSKCDGYDTTTIPAATAENMLVYMDKINELIEKVNALERAGFDRRLFQPL